MKHIFIINPTAGKGVKTTQLLSEIEAASRKTGQLEVETYVTQGVGAGTISSIILEIHRTF